AADRGALDDDLIARRLDDLRQVEQGVVREAVADDEDAKRPGVRGGRGGQQGHEGDQRPERSLHWSRSSKVPRLGDDRTVRAVGTSDRDGPDLEVFGADRLAAIVGHRCDCTRQAYRSCTGGDTITVVR